jgi:hypothetical protein
MYQKEGRKEVHKRKIMMSFGKIQRYMYDAHEDEISKENKRKYDIVMLILHIA